MSEMAEAEFVARQFHETYERLAPTFGYETRRESRTPWSQVPEHNRSLMIATARELLDEGVIRVADVRKEERFPIPIMEDSE